jgi:hypothetical protein
VSVVDAADINVESDEKDSVEDDEVEGGEWGEFGSEETGSEVTPEDPEALCTGVTVDSTTLLDSNEDSTVCSAMAAELVVVNTRGGSIDTTLSAESTEGRTSTTVGDEREAEAMDSNTGMDSTTLVGWLLKPYTRGGTGT